MGIAYNLSRKIFGDLTVIKEHPERYFKQIQWECLCKCGATKIAAASNLTLGKTKTCGSCNWHIKHKEAYTSWNSMRMRCTNPNNIGYAYYGGRGIKVCERWNKFTNFLDDMGDPPTDPTTGKRFTLDRIDSNKDYTPDNCRWADKITQANNKSKLYIS